MPEQKLSLPGVPPKTEIANNLGSAKRAVIYTRVSTGDQHAETQLYDLRELAKQRRFEIVHEYTDTISGAKSKRPGLDQLLADARRHRFDVVLVAAFDRVARNVRHFLEVLDELSHLNIEFVSLRENIDTGGPLGRAMVVIENRARAEDAQLKSNQTVEMVGLGRLELPTYGLGNPLSSKIGAIIANVNAASRKNCTHLVPTGVILGTVREAAMQTGSIKKHGKWWTLKYRTN